MEWDIWCMVSELTSDQPLRRQRSKFTGLKHFFSNLTFSSMTSELLVVEQQIWYHRIFLVETNWVVPNFVKKKYCKVSSPVKFRVTFHVMSKLVILVSIDSEPRETNTWVPLSLVYHFRFKSHGHMSNFPHWVIMEWVQNWPDLRSLKWKLRSIHAVGIHSSISSWKFPNIRTIPQHDLEVWRRSRGTNLTLTDFVTWLFWLRSKQITHNT